MGRGRGWFGERKRHAAAARKGLAAKDLAPHGAPLLASVSDLLRADQVRDAISATDESLYVGVEVHMENAIEWIEAVTYGPKFEGASLSKAELRKAYTNIDRLINNAMNIETDAKLTKQLRDVRTAARIAKAQL